MRSITKPMRQTRSLRIQAPPEKVWSLLDDERKLRLWLPNIVETRYPGGKPKDNPVGARFVQVMDQGGGQTSSYEGEITEYEKGRLLAILLRPQAFAIHTVYHISGDEDWTRLDYGCDVQPTTWRGYLMIWWGRRLLNRILDQQLIRLKLVAEDKLPTG